MDTLQLLTLHLSRAYGIAIVAVALAALLSPQRLSAALADFQRSPGLTLLGAIFALCLGLTLVMLHSTWVDVPAILVSLLGWAILVKAIVLLAIPDVLFKLGGAGKPSTTRIWGVIALILGAVYLAIGIIGRASIS